MVGGFLSTARRRLGRTNLPGVVCPSLLFLGQQAGKVVLSLRFEQGA